VQKKASVEKLIAEIVHVTKQGVAFPDAAGRVDESRDFLLFPNHRKCSGCLLARLGEYGCGGSGGRLTASEKKARGKGKA
jgi:hypothetical protein